jgi:hypothetical protein
MPVWENVGCPVCRRLWEIGQQPPLVVTNVERHIHLHRCASCGTWWEQTERFAVPISEAQARCIVAENDSLES